MIFPIVCIAAYCTSIVLIVLISLWVTTKDGNGCGVPMIMWFYVLFGVVELYVILLVILLICANRCCGCACDNWGIYMIAFTVGLFTFLVAWGIYGWVIFA